MVEKYSKLKSKRENENDEKSFINGPNEKYETKVNELDICIEEKELVKAENENNRKLYDRICTPSCLSHVCSTISSRRPCCPPAHHAAASPRPGGVVT